MGIRQVEDCVKSAVTGVGSDYDIGEGCRQVESDETRMQVFGQGDERISGGKWGKGGEEGCAGVRHVTLVG